MRFKPLFASCLLLSVLAVHPVLADDGFVWSEKTQVSAEDVINYWTKERMENAKPCPMPSLEGATKEVIPPGTMHRANGEPGFSPGGMPGLEGVLSNKDLGSSELPPLVEPLIDTLSAGVHGYTYPFPFTRFEVLKKLYKIYPYRTIGRVFFTEGGSNFACSGSSIGGRAVLTAGHCVSDGFGNYHTNWVFMPAFRDGRSKGKWPAESLVAFPAWHNNSDICRDVGFAVTKKRNGKKLSQRVGSLGFAWNLDSEHLHWNLFGYPAAISFGGQRMFECQASFGTWDTPGCDPLSPTTIGVGCDMTGGSSGGPWIMDFAPGKTGLVNLANSVNSYTYDFQPEAMYGPYFDTAVNDLKEDAISQ